MVLAISTPSIEQRLPASVAETQAVILGSEVRLHCSLAIGDQQPDSAIDLSITVLDHWMATNNSFHVFGKSYNRNSTTIANSIQLGVI